MAIRTDFAPGEVLAAADVNDTFASKPTKTFGTAVPSSPVSGDLFFDTADTPPTPKFFDGSVFQGIGGGKILQVVRATDTTERTTSSTSFVDVTGMSVTITPQKSTSTVLLIASFNFNIVSNGTSSFGDIIMTDSSNNGVSGAQGANMGIFGITRSGASIQTFGPAQLFGFATPASTSAVTFKLRFKIDAGSANITLKNNLCTGQMYAIEVSA